MSTINTKRLQKVEKLELKRGSHKSLKEGACVMEMVSYVAGEKWSDSPACTSPVLSAYARHVNDNLDDGGRQALKPLILKLVGSRNDDLDKERADFLALQSITVFFAPSD